jgi:hypothetical protein
MDPFSFSNIWKLGLAGCFLLALMLAILKSPRAALLALAAMIPLASLGVAEEAANNTDYRTWLLPLQERRTIMAAGCAGLLALGVFAHAYRVNLRQTPLLGWVYLLQGIYMGMVSIIHGEELGGGLTNGLTSIVFAIAISCSFMFFMSVVLKEWDDYLALVRALALGGALWTFVCTVQFFINHQILITGTGKRFVGLSGNPQHAAGLSAAMAMIATWMVMNEPKKRWRPFWLFVAASHVVFVLWTGSRTGALCTTAGMTAIFYARLGRAVLFAPLAVGAILGLVAVATSMGVKFGFERLTSTQDTRSEVWSVLWTNAMQNPVFGLGATDAGASENGFLYGFAAYGAVVPMLLLLQLAMGGGLCLMLIRARSGAGELQKRMADLCIGYLAMYWVGNMTEGYGIARMSPQVPLYLTFVCLAWNLVLKMREDAHAAAYPAEADGMLATSADQPAADLSDGGDYSWYGRSA